MHLHRAFIAAVLCALLIPTGAGRTQHTTGDLARYLAQLGDRSPVRRWEAITALASAGVPAMPLLVRGLADSSIHVRMGSARALGIMGPAARVAEGALVDALADTSAPVREEAVAALGLVTRGDTRSVTPLARCLSDGDPFVVGKAGSALASIGTSALPGVVKILLGTDPAARTAATIVLGKMGTLAASAALDLTRALTDDHADVRYGAAHALGRIGPPARIAIPALLDALSDPDQDVRTAATLALEHIDPSAVLLPSWQTIAAIIDTLTPRLMRDVHVPGVSIALIQKNAVVWSRQYGAANVTTGAAVTDSTMFEACSMSKPILAVIALRLAERGVLDLDQPLVEYLDLPSLRGQPGRERITARMALSHTTGLPNWRRGDDERDGPLPIQFPPGSRFGYSGEAIYYLQQVIESITGMPLDVLAEREIFAPLRLRHMSFTWQEDFGGLIAGGHTAEGTYRTTTRYTHANAAYSLYTSAVEYARFIIAVMRPATSGGLLSARSTAAMLAHQVPVPAREPVERPGRGRATAVYWGLGWAINATGQGDIIHHSGSNQSGFRCFSQFNPATGAGIVIMTNGANGSDVWTRLISRIGNL